MNNPRLTPAAKLYLANILAEYNLADAKTIIKFLDGTLSGSEEQDLYIKLYTIEVKD